MRILLVLDRVENPASANALMGFRLAEQLLRRDHTGTYFDPLGRPAHPARPRRRGPCSTCWPLPMNAR